MLTRKQKLTYFKSSLIKTLNLEGYGCPSCGAKNSVLVDRKYFVTSLRRCRNCSLLFRAPTTSDREYERFYQEEYSEGFTTDIPSEDELFKLKKNDFRNSGKDYSVFIEILKEIGYENGDLLLDYGCSWGYGSWQFANAGLKVVGYEVSRKRCAFARDKLGVDAHHELARLRGGRKVKFFFSSHVLEHIPRINDVIKFAREMVAPGGYFLAFTPNGSMDYRALDPKGWSQIWGFVHPLFVDTVYYMSAFVSDSYFIDSNKYDLGAIRTWAANQSFSQEVIKSNGPELMIAVRFQG